MNVKQKALEWFNDLPERDKWIFSVGSIGALIFCIYILVWEPLVKDIDTLTTSVQNQKEDFIWMQSAVREINTIRDSAKQAQVKSRGSQSLIGLVDELARSNQLGNAIQRIQPNQTSGVQVWLKHAVFDDVLNWLVALSEYGVIAANIKLRGQNEPGLVNVEVILKEAGTA